MRNKLKMYLRGLGIGIMVTALILSIVNLNKNKGMTEAEIRAEASKLGMVDANNYSLTDAAADSSKNCNDSDIVSENGISETEETENAGEVQTSTDSENTGDGQTATDSEVSDDAKINDDTAVTDDDTTVTDDDTAVTDDDTAVTDDDTAVTDDGNKTESDDTGTTDNEENQSSENQTGEDVSITIPKGSGSEKVASIIKDAGLISDDKDFNSYMEKNGYSRKIHSGTFSIPSGSDYEAICKIIAK